ncbi:hypothetical protein MTO96_046428 [Rhipicephalus appendiculatus]
MRRTRHICGNTLFTFLCSLLNEMNVSLTHTRVTSDRAAASLVIGGQVDILLRLTALTERMAEVFSFADADIHYDTFYARANDTRSVSVFTVLSYSAWGVALTLLSALTATLVLTSLNSVNNWKAFLQGVLREATFLTASLLATSVPEPRNHSYLRTRRSVYACWIMAILSLSVYIRSQMTALVTVVQPANHLDTLEELEQALDAGDVAPVVARDSAHFTILGSASLHSSSLLRKLNAAYKRHSKEDLIAPTLEDCFLQAERHDRVCYSALQPRCTMLKLAPAVRPFRQPMTMMLYGIPVRRDLSLLPALRRLLLAVREGLLARVPEVHCDADSTSTQQNVELVEFMKQYWILQLVAVAVFLAECLINLFCKVWLWLHQ